MCFYDQKKYLHKDVACCSDAHPQGVTRESIRTSKKGPKDRERTVYLLNY